MNDLLSILQEDKKQFAVFPSICLLKITYIGGLT